MRLGALLIMASTWPVAMTTSLAQLEYTADGAPTALEEEIRWLMNRARFDTAQENVRRGTSYKDVPATAGPLAAHNALTLASRHHSEDMARHNLFQHDTVPGSAYYNATTQPKAWDRMTAEGYSWNQAAENIAAGYSSAEVAYIGWWNSTGHRVNMAKAALREVGNGYFNLSGSAYGRYYTMDLGSSGANHFFTDTIFRDSNNNGKYDQGEGIAGIGIKLRIKGVLHTALDRSSAAGTFAVPIQAIADGSPVEVLLENSTSEAQVVTIPRTYSAYSNIELKPGGSETVGTFNQPSGSVNVGFRNLAASPAPALQLTFQGGSVELRLSTQIDLNYRLQWTSNFMTWTDLTATDHPGTGSEIAVKDSAHSSGTARRFYRVATRRP